jgi:hypothetical protein
MSNLNVLVPQNRSPLMMTDDQKLRELIRLVTDGLSSEHSRRAYTKALRDFLAWHSAQGRPQLSKALVQRYRLKLEGDGLSSSTINQRMSAIRKLAVEAADNGLLDPVLAHGIKGVRGVRTYAPRGETPLLRVPLTRDHLSAISAVTPHGKLYMMVQNTAFDGPAIVRFLRHLLRHIPGKLLLIWDGLAAHHGQAVKTFLAQGAAQRLHLERLPGYAPDLNPDEGVCST